MQGGFVIALLPIFSVGLLDHHRGFRNLLIYAVFVAMWLLPFSVLVLAAWKLRGPIYWQLIFRGLVASISALLLGWCWSEICIRYWRNAEVFGVLTFFSGLALSIVFVSGMAVAPLMDWNTREKLDILHWIGAALLPAHVLWLVVCVIIFRLTG